MTDINKPYKVISNDFIFYFDDADLASVDLFKKTSTAFNAIKDHRSVNAVIVEADKTNKTYRIVIEGTTFVIGIRDELDQMLEKMGFGETKNKQLSHIKAPMPGLVLEIAIKEGQAVSKGEKILILEAMKMENSLLIPVDAVIKTILVTKGQAVEKGQVLVELEP